MRTHRFSSRQGPQTPQPVLLLSGADANGNTDDIVRQIQRFSMVDDVFSDAFISNILLIYPSQGSCLKKGALKSRLDGTQLITGKSWELQTIFTATSLAPDDKFQSGPYFLFGSNVFQAWKLYVDRFSCFQTTVLPAGSQYEYVTSSTPIKRPL